MPGMGRAGELKYQINVKKSNLR